MRQALCMLRNIGTLVVFLTSRRKQWRMEGEEYWPLGQFEPGRAAAGASQHEHEPAAITYSEIFSPYR